MAIQAEIIENRPQESRSSQKATAHWTPEQCRVQNTLLLAGCNLAECLENLLALPGAQLLLDCNNHSVKCLEDAIEHWFNTGEHWMQVFGKASKL